MDKKYVQSINELFPDASIIRMDIDTTNVKNGHEIILSKFRDEKIDIVKWSEDPAEYIAASLSPAKVLSTVINEEDSSAKVTVPEYQLSLAIGKSGQNVRLAARLTGWKIDISAE